MLPGPDCTAWKEMESGLTTSAVAGTGLLPPIMETVLSTTRTLVDAKPAAEMSMCAVYTPAASPFGCAVTVSVPPDIAIFSHPLGMVSA